MKLRDFQPGDIVKIADATALRGMVSAFTGTINLNSKFKVILVAANVLTYRGKDSGLVVYQLDKNGNTIVNYPYVWDAKRFIKAENCDL